MIPRTRSPGLSENPLLPHRKLRELHALMLRCRALERRQKSEGWREALLAATLMQLLPGDLVSASEGDAAAGQLAPAAKKPGSGSVVGGAAIEARLALGAAAARGLQAAASDALVLAFARAGGAEPGWAHALEWAQQTQLPLIVACTDATNGALSRSVKVKEPGLDFVSISRLAKRLKLPVLTVDGEDAVAVYRVMQESVLRARQGGGPAVLWAVMTPARSIAKMPASSQPIARLRSYLSARKISLKA
jgi:TPP-dependent pyruvate/acetoin dehydrogenase alpha subunit